VARIVVLTLAVAGFAASRVIEVVLALLVEGVPQFKGMPVPMVVLGALIAGLVLRARLHAPDRRWYG
jgi:hypothetical protein